jgi:CRP-like cAMP-binding protein
MSSSYEKEVKESGLKESKTSKLDFSMMKYLWMANPLSRARRDSIPRFLRNVELLKNFSDNELRILAKYMHSRKFAEGDMVFREGEVGIGFYFIFSGIIELSRNDYGNEMGEEKFLSLDEFSYFGEMALLQEANPRSATAYAKSPCELVGIFKPDLEHLSENQPVIATKLIKSISLALADRLYYLTEEASKLSRRLRKVEKQLAEAQNSLNQDG